MMRKSLATLVTMIALAVASNALAGPINVTNANDSVQLTNMLPKILTGTGQGSYTISDTSYNAVGSLTVNRSDTSLVYQWVATPDFAQTLGVGIRAVEAFTLSNAADFRLTFTGPYLDGYLWNTDTNSYVEKFGYKSGNTGPTPPFTITGFLAAGNYELRLNTGSLPNFSAASGEVDFAVVPDGGTTVMLLGGALIGLGALRRKFRL
jgi:hypothetical protein